MVLGLLLRGARVQRVVRVSSRGSWVQRGLHGEVPGLESARSFAGACSGTGEVEVLAEGRLVGKSVVLPGGCSSCLHGRSLSHIHRWELLTWKPQVQREWGWSYWEEPPVLKAPSTGEMSRWRGPVSAVRAWGVWGYLLRNMRMKGGPWLVLGLEEDGGPLLGSGLGPEGWKSPIGAPGPC